MVKLAPIAAPPPWIYERRIGKMFDADGCIVYLQHPLIMEDVQNAINERARLLDVLKARCAYHHIALHNGRAHRLTRPNGKLRTVKCRLSPAELAAIAKAEGKSYESAT